MTHVLARRWSSSDAADENHRPFAVDLDLRDRRPQLTLRGAFAAAPAAAVLEGILLRLDQINAPIAIDADGVSAFDTRTAQIVLDAARRRAGRAAPPISFVTSSSAVDAALELLGGGTLTHPQHGRSVAC